ncbi:MAG: hypothetical protein ACK5XN_06440 [Bacteroidota bacterium]
MKEKINEEVLCVLRKKHSNEIIIDYVDIINPFKSLIIELRQLCDDTETTIDQIVSYIKDTKEFEQLTAQYRYCISLKSAFQGFSANNQEYLKEINERYQLMLFNKKENPENYNFKQAVAALKLEIAAKYYVWSKAYSINKAYRLCYEDKSILTFSHRIDGWSNPIYQLTPNFSVEIKTNFGYGRVSYFYTKLKYKNIDITPFSEWVEYEFAQFTEIIRYTRSHLLKNEYWLEAMEFASIACNLSLTNEVKFVERFIIDECETMVCGLEELFNKEQFSFKNRNGGQYSVKKNGHDLVEYRGEKISGALDFISKIIEFDKITSIKQFIERIELCNRRIQPILVEEDKLLEIEIAQLKKEKQNLDPKHEKVLRTNNEYRIKRIQLMEELIKKGVLIQNNIDSNKLEIEFKREYPEYEKFKKEYNDVIGTYEMLKTRIQKNTIIRDNIIIYHEKIKNYFNR